MTKMASWSRAGGMQHRYCEDIMTCDEGLGGRKVSPPLGSRSRSRMSAARMRCLRAGRVRTRYLRASHQNTLVASESPEHASCERGLPECAALSALWATLCAF